MKIKFLKDSDNRTKEILKGSSFMFASSLICNLMRVGVIAVLSRYYSKEEFGLWVTITSTTAVIATGDFGIVNALRNKISTLLVKGEIGDKISKQYFYDTLIFFFILALLLGLLLFLLKDIIPFECLFMTNNLILKEQGIQIILWTLFLFFINIPVSLGTPMFFSYQESSYSALFTTIQAIFSFVLIFALTIFDLSIVFVSIAYFISNIFISLCATLYFLYVRKWFVYEFILSEFYFHVKELFATGLKFMGLQLSTSFIQNAGTIVVSSSLGLGIAAEYNMIQKLYTFIVGIYQSIFNPIWGAYANAAITDDWAWCKKISIKLDVVSVSVFIFSIILMVLFGNFALNLLGGKEYRSSILMFIYLGVGSLLFILTYSASLLQNSIGKITLPLFCFIAASITITPMMKYFAFTWGVDGVAIAAIFVWFILFVIFKTQAVLYLRKKISAKLYGK